MELLMNRNYLSMLPDGELINLARENYNPLAEILAERVEEVQVDCDAILEELREKINDLQLDINQQDDKIYLLRQEVARGESIIAGMAEEIKNLKEQAND